MPSFLPKKFLTNINRRKKKSENKTGDPSKFLHQLTPEQQAVFDGILASEKNTSLIHGITGAGKTEIYLHLAEHFAKQEKQTLILVPEISLTPQVVNYFKRCFEDQLSAIHSKLSEGEKIQAWENIFSGKSKVIIGSRSAIFAPFQNLGAIIIDEEHDSSYKQDQSPRYHARSIAEKIAQLTKAKIVLGSATPAIESYFKAKENIYNLFTLKKRAQNQSLPQTQVIDMRQEKLKSNYSPFSDTLLNQIKNKLEQKEQVLLFLNKRGSSSSIFCKSCGKTFDCPKCDTPINYHHTPSFQKTPTLLCHHCGIIKAPPSTCPECQSAKLQFFGFGTQKIEAELQKIFPEARILRADKDTTSTKHGFAEIYQKFRNHEADILIGTQMITKGLHLPKVNLVGVILADIGLHIPDFRAHERAFQLLTQVAGRAGRKSGRGKVLIQTYNPEHPIIQLATEQDFEKLYKFENPTRALLPYPPYSELIKLQFEDKNAKTALKTAQALKKTLDETAKKLTATSAASPTSTTGTTTNLTHPAKSPFKLSLYPAMLHKRNEKYRWCILINGQNPRQLISQIQSQNPAILEKWSIDINPSFTA